MLDEEMEDGSSAATACKNGNSSHLAAAEVGGGSSAVVDGENTTANHGGEFEGGRLLSEETTDVVHQDDDNDDDNALVAVGNLYNSSSNNHEEEDYFSAISSNNDRSTVVAARKHAPPAPPAMNHEPEAPAVQQQQPQQQEEEPDSKPSATEEEASTTMEDVSPGGTQKAPPTSPPAVNHDPKAAAKDHQQSQEQEEEPDSKPAAVVEASTAMEDVSSGEKDDNYDDQKPAVQKSRPDSDDDDSNNHHDNEDQEEEEKDDDDDRKPTAQKSRPDSDEDYDDGDHEEEEDDDDDRKPAARHSNDDDDEDSSDSDSDDDSSNQHVDAEGRNLSEYEIQRLERIKRNKEYLAQLGLEQGKDMMARQVQQQQQQRRKKKKPPPVNGEKDVPEPVRRTSRSRRSKLKRVSYAEPSISVRALLRDAAEGNGVIKEGDDGGADDSKGDSSGSTKQQQVANVMTPSATAEQPTAVTTEEQQQTAIDTTKGEKKKKKSHKERMELFIFTEFRRINSSKRQALRLAERNVRAAEKEDKYWKKLLRVWERQQKRKRDAQRQRENLNGQTAKEVLQEIDRRMPEILHTIRAYDDSLQSAKRGREKETKRLETEHRMKVLNALNRFPKAMKSAVNLLNTVLVERAPKDPPPPRRSKRTTIDEQEPETSSCPQNKKAPGDKRKAESSSPSDHDDNDEEARLETRADLEIDDAGAENGTNGNNKKTRKRNVRNVGGWISPEFAQEIDRTWLTQDRHKETFDLATYVPQPGDTVLYFISGHRQFLEEYPDVFGKKTRSKSRIPLWEKAAQLKEELEGNEQSPEEAKVWWTDEWLYGVESCGLGDYPVLCRVERTHAEFPPDPYVKVVKKDDTTMGTKVYFKKPKGFSASGEKTHMRLAVTLKPLTPLVPPDSGVGGQSASASLLALPPAFSVVTFPSKLEPFLVPFAWAYTVTHFQSIDQKVLLASDGSKVRIDGFLSLHELDTMRLAERTDRVKRVLAHFKASQSKSSVLESQLQKEDFPLPLRDARIVLDVLHDVSGPGMATTVDESPQLHQPVSFAELVRSTLPLWKSVVVMKNIYDGQKYKFSPWRLIPSGKARIIASPWDVGHHAFRLDEALRVKIVCCIENILAEHPVASDLFTNAVTDDIAPSYSCAVPVGMSFDAIMKRLRLRGKYHRCFYRSVDAVLSDVTSILDCCLLYNSPESEVVEEAVGIVTQTKAAIARVTQEHFREAKEARKADEERRLLVLRHSQTAGSEERSASSASTLHTLRKPFKDKIQREWLQQSTRILSEQGLQISPFQAGDKIQYSIDLHRRFIKGHYPSLEVHQCIVALPNDAPDVRSSSEVQENLAPPSGTADDWKSGEIIWVKASFPKALSKESGEDANTFSSMAVLQHLGVKFQNSKVICELFWRPCQFDNDTSKESSSCPGCGLDLCNSFIRLDRAHPPEDVSCLDYREMCEHTAALSVNWCSSVDRCVTLLKRRCLNEHSPSYVDPQLTKENVKAGYKLPQARLGMKTLPTFEKLFDGSPVGDSESNHTHGIRRVCLKNLRDDPTVSKLVEAGFLPPWASSASEGSVDDGLLQKLDTMLPNAKLCLELVQLRLRNGYYRHRVAVENDLAEAYVTTVFCNLSGPMARKKKPLSLKKLVRAMSAKENTEVAPAKTELSEEEVDWLNRLRRIRDLFAVALTAVSDTGHVERIFGLATYLAPKVDTIEETVDHDPVRVAARQKLDLFLACIGRDECQNPGFGNSSDSTYPIIKLAVKVGGRKVLGRRSSDDAVTPLVAQVQDGFKKVKVVCEGEPVVFGSASSATNEENDFQRNQTTLSKLCSAVSSSIFLVSEDYEHSDKLAGLLFNQPGRTAPCARCSAYQRSMLACRVVRRHSNLDFSLSDDLKGGVSHVDDLLRVLGGEDGVEPIRSISDSARDATDPEKLPAAPEEGLEATQDDAIEAEQEDTFDPTEFSRKAESVLELSKRNLEEAKLFSEAPARLSKEFVTEEFPIDESDGHYLYCVVCGLSGDLLCCDGCPNVVHSSCVSLEDLPEGDWFCEECEAGKLSVGTHGSMTSEQPLLQSVLNGVRSIQASPRPECPPFGRSTFDETRIEEASSILEDLRDARPTHRSKTTSTRDADAENEEDSDNEGDQGEVSHVKKRRGRPPKRKRESLDPDEGTGRKKAKTTAAEMTKYVGRRMAREFENDAGEAELFFGTVKRGWTDRIFDLWSIDYDDGDKEDLETLELRQCFALYERKKEEDVPGCK